MNRFVYADNAGTTKLSAAALAAMMPYLTEDYGNPSSVYGIGRKAKRALETARETVAAAIGAQPEELFFTSSATEANNWALRSAARALSEKGRHIISSAIEHPAVLHTLEDLEKTGFSVTYLPVDELGRVSPDRLKAALRDDTILISIMAANNEIGTILPTDEIGKIAKEAGIYFHTDAVQAAGHIPVDVETMHIDLLSLSAHKFGGPRGAGALYMRKGLRLPALITGGGQEKGRRAGTENVAAICGMSAALLESVNRMEAEARRVSVLRDRLIEGLCQIPFSRLTGDPANRLPGSASFVFECVEGEAMILSLDNAGICASSGSACSSGSLEPSHVLMAIGLPHEIAHGSVRLTLGPDNTDADVDYILETLPRIVERLRAMSPLWEEKLHGAAK